MEEIMKHIKWWLGIGIGILLVSLILLFTKAVKCYGVMQEGNKFEDTRVILYDGPKTLVDATEEDIKSTSELQRDITLKHCVDTQIKVNGYDCYVYDTNVNHSRSWSSSYTPSLSRTPLAYFDFEGVVEIEVKVPDIMIESVKISPLSYGIEPEIDADAHTVKFTIDTPDTYTITFNDQVLRAIHIIAYDIEEEPDLTEENLIYIGPGEWNADAIMLEDNQTLYISGGAVVHGFVNANRAKNITVKGHGIIDGSYYSTWKGMSAYIPLKFDSCSNITLEDVIVLNANAWACQAFNSDNGVMDGLHIITARPNGDGISIQSCTDYEVKNCFVRSWDDSLVVKNYARSSENITFKHMQLWTDLAQSMEVGFETNKGNREDSYIKNITFEDITVLNNFHKPVISVHNADDAEVSEITFRDIVVENAQMGSGDGSEMPYLIDLLITKNSNWSTTAERGTIHDILIENVTVLSGKFNASRISGFDETHKVTEVQIKNLEILGQKIDSFESGQFEIDAATTDGLSIE